MAQTCPYRAKMALLVFVPFATTYESEAAFSILIHFKTKHRSRLAVTSDTRIALHKTHSQIDELIAAKQVHPPH